MLNALYGRAALAGVLSGIVMAMVAMMITAFNGMGFWTMPTMIGGLLLGPSAVAQGGVGIIIVGLAIHMMLSGLFGIAYALIITAAPWLCGCT
jgi:hypothetical protein